MVYLATERVEPLYNRLTQKCNSENESKKELYFSWGIFQITVCINETSHMSRQRFLSDGRKIYNTCCSI